MKAEEKILIGGRALIALGSSRNTLDTDYLVNDITSKEAFIKNEKENIKYLNANGHDFFKELYEIEKGNQIASPQSLLELKALSFVLHSKNSNYQKADDSEYDIKFLVRQFNLQGVTNVRKYITAKEFKEVEKVIRSTKR